jgi:Ca-activated chloride channel family protein
MIGFELASLSELHFLRPLWLLAIPALVLMVWVLKRPGGSLQAWRQVCDEHLLAHLTSGEAKRGSRNALWMLAVGWVVASLALAGPWICPAPCWLLI